MSALVLARWAGGRPWLLYEHFLFNEQRIFWIHIQDYKTADRWNIQYSDVYSILDELLLRHVSISTMTFSGLVIMCG